MFKRVRWVATGFAAGVGTSLYGAYKARSLARRYTPPEMAQRAAAGAIRAHGRVRDALVEGRAAMHERETELRLKHSR